MLSKSILLGKKKIRSANILLVFTKGLLHFQIFPFKKKKKKVLPYVSSHVFSGPHIMSTGIRTRKARSIAEYSYKWPQGGWGRGRNYPQKSAFIKK